MLRCTSATKRLNRVADQSLWRHRCLNDFPTWDSRHRLSTLLTKPLREVNWRTLYKERLHVNYKTQETLDSIISSQSGRLGKVRSITAHLDDLKDVLRVNLSVPESAPDVLARRWYSKALYGHVQRAKAVETWSDLSEHKSVSLIEALLSFDKFILCENAVGQKRVSSQISQSHSAHMSQVNALLDEIASSLVAHTASWATQTLREKASTIAAYLLDENLVGLSENQRYMDVRNSLLSVALTHPDRPSLPLISTVLYCAVAKRLGLDAKPCGFPTHVYTIVSAPPGYDLDGNMVSKDGDPGSSTLYLDPFQSAKPKPLIQLQETLANMGIHTSDCGSFLEPASDIAIVMRCAKNIINAVQELHVDSHGDETLEFEPGTALYASMWCLILLSGSETSPNQDAVERKRSFLPLLIKLFESHHPFDATLVLDYVIPMFDCSPQRDILRNYICDVFSKDSIPKQHKLRQQSGRSEPKYFLGQLFRHRRYGYKGMIYGWDGKCMMPDDWIQHMHVPDLERGKQQPFYHIL